MAKGRVELTCCKCGEEFWVEKTCYNRTDANEWEAWMKDQNRLCKECYAEEMRQKREAEKAAEAAKNAEAAAECPIQLPGLTGSEKQIKWAKDIRNKLIAKLTRMGIKWDIIAGGEFPVEHQDKIKAEIAKLQNPSAKYWIELRGKTIFDAKVE